MDRGVGRFYAASDLPSTQVHDGIQAHRHTGGRVEGETRRRGPLLKLGALELQLGRPPPRKTPASEAEIRIPPTFFQRLLPPDALTTVRTRGALVAVGFLCGYLARQLRSPVRVRVNLEWNEESRSVRAVRRFTKLLGGGIEA